MDFLRFIKIEHRFSVLKAASPICFALLIVGCASSKSNVQDHIQAANYDPAKTARIRFITGDTTHAAYISGHSCESFYGALKSQSADQLGQKNPHIDTPGLYPWRDSDKRNMLIGMPSSKKSIAINSTLKQYDEVVVPAGTPLLAFFAAGGSQYSCWPKPIRFIPEAGHDYELELEYVQSSTFSGGCIIGARELKAEGGITNERPLPRDFCVKDLDGTFRTVSPLTQLQKSQEEAEARK